MKSLSSSPFTFLRTPLSLACGLALLALPAALQAQIVWGTSQNITGDGDVATNGMFVDAMYVGSGPATPLTVNGVTFTEVTAGSGAFSTTNITFTANGTSPSGMFHGTALANSSTDYQNLLLTVGYGIDPFAFTLSGLTVGETYQVQIWANAPQDENHLVTAFNWSGSPSIDLGTPGNSWGAGQYIVGTFVASASTFTISPVAVGPDGVNNGINAVSLRQVSVPEPGTATLLGLSLGAVLLARRKR